ncbi:MAG: hypothetical protein V3V68_05195 [Nitrosomonadaceae bacterium]
MGGKIDIQIKHREKVLKLRRLDRLIQSDEFTYIWRKINSTEKLKVRIIIEEGFYYNLKTWIQDRLDLGFKLYSIRDLRALASKHHVSYYSRKTRAELIKALVEKGVLDGNTGGTLGKDETIPSSCGCQEGSSGPINSEATLENGCDNV